MLGLDEGVVVWQRHFQGVNLRDNWSYIIYGDLEDLADLLCPIKYSIRLTLNILLDYVQISIRYCLSILVDNV